MFCMHLLQLLKSVAGITFQAMKRSCSQQAFIRMMFALVLLVIQKTTNVELV